MVKRASILADLKEAQEQDRRLSPEAMAEIAERHGISESQLYGTATFYSLLGAELQPEHVIRLCGSVACHLAGINDLVNVIHGTLGIGPGESAPDGSFGLEIVSCLGACGCGPAAMIDDRLYTNLGPEKLQSLISDTSSGRIPPADEPAFSPRALGEPALMGESSPDLSTLINRSSEEILTALDASGLRGRGGAAFPTGRKWRMCAEAPGDERFIVCNADEGEPGTFKDRYLLREHAGLVVAGMLLAAQAVGAERGYIYLRAEYPELREIIERETAGHPIELVVGAGAYVCGEETALLESIEGRRGVPRLRPPYPPASGLFGKPTVIDNVETLANVPLIVSRGAEWFAGLGTPESGGTKLLSVSGDAAAPGVIEAPFGLRLSEVLDEAGAGASIAALVGGASGRLIPRRDFDRRLCFEDLSPGAGAIIPVGEDRSIRELVSNLMAFFEHESCGECSPCRIGTARAHELLDRGGDPAILQSLGETMAASSRCGLGQSAPTALLDALEAFPEQFSFENETDHDKH